MKEGLSGRVLSGVEESRCLGVAIGAGLWCEKSEGRGRRAEARFGRVVTCEAHVNYIGLGVWENGSLRCG